MPPKRAALSSSGEIAAENVVEQLIECRWQGRCRCFRAAKPPLAFFPSPPWFPSVPGATAPPRQNPRPLVPACSELGHVRQCHEGIVQEQTTTERGISTLHATVQSVTSLDGQVLPRDIERCPA